LMGGTIKVSSEVSVGSQFSILIPLVFNQSVDANAVVPPKAMDQLDLTDKRILIAEDDSINSTLITCILEKYHPLIKVVENGVAAVDACQQDHYDIILMDCMMPEMDGYEATSRIRAMPSVHWKTVPVIALTANALPGDRERCLLAGMSDYVSKPIRRVELDAALRRALIDRRESESSEAIRISSG